MLVKQVQASLNSKHVVSCCKRVCGEINARHDIIFNILLNNILKQRGLVVHEQKWEEMKTVRTASNEITIGTSTSGPTSGRAEAGLLVRG